MTKTKQETTSRTDERLFLRRANASGSPPRRGEGLGRGQREWLACDTTQQVENAVSRIYRILVPDWPEVSPGVARDVPAEW